MGMGVGMGDEMSGDRFSSLCKLPVSKLGRV